MVGQRTVQKKLIKLVTDFVQSEAIQELLDGVESEAPIEILLNPSLAEARGDDIDAVKEDLEAAFKHLSKKKGKMAKASRELQGVINGLDELQHSVVGEKRSLPMDDTGGGGSKRNRGTVAENSTEFTREQKGDFRAIVQYLSKLPSCAAFLYPVDRRLYAEYYEVIDSPMDISTLRKNINSFESLTDALLSLRQIWKNCLQFNLEGSEIALQAIESGQEAERLIEEKFGKSRVDLSWKRQSRREARGKQQLSKPRDQTADVSKSKEPKTSTMSSDMKSFLTLLWSSEYAQPFLEPVDPDEAPGYLDVIAMPMDLLTVKRKLRSGAYGANSFEFLSDIDRVWANCLTYNLPGSDIAMWAKKMSDLSAKTSKDFNFGDFKWSTQQQTEKHSNVAAVKKSGKARESEEPVDQLPLSDQNMKALLAKLQQFEFISPFLLPVNPADVPDYLDIVRHPMDLSTVQRKLKANSYRGHPSQFVADVLLIWNNCKEYNESASDIYQWAERCDSFFQNSLADLIGGERPAQCDKTFPVAYNSSEIGGDLDEQDCDDLDDGDEEMDDDDHDQVLADGRKGTAAKPPKKQRVPITFRVRKYRSVVRQLLLHESAGPFISKDVAPPVLPQTVTPLDLTTIKDRLETYQDSAQGFLDDLKLVFDIYLTHCTPKSEIFIAAEKMKVHLLDIFAKAFPSLTAAKIRSDIPPSAVVSTSMIGSVSTLKALKPAEQSARPNVGRLDVPPMVLAYDHRGFAFAEDMVDDLPPILPQSKMNTIELDDVLCALKQAPQSCRDIVVKFVQKRGEILRARSTWPLPIAPGRDVLALGTIPKCQQPVCASTFICAVGYKSKVSVSLVLFDESLRAESADPKQQVVLSVPLCLTSCVKMDSANTFRFVVALDSGTVIAEDSCPFDAWKKVVGKELITLRTLGGKLKRCRAVFNRMCTSPDCMPFLEQIPIATSTGANYYKEITSPMWLREVHQRLISGEYDNEFDFAWDVRLIFRNCCNYNAAGSELYLAATRLSALFESLLASWVLSIVEASVDISPAGPWDEWMHLNYFDLSDSAECFCRKTGIKGRKSDFLHCRWCEDQYLPSAVGSPKLSAKDNWTCARCQRALDCSGNDLSAPYSFSTGDLSSSVQGTALEAPTFSPAPELGHGWCVGKYKVRSTVKLVYLSPLGYEVRTKDGVPHQKVFEDAVDRQLLDAREKEFKEQVSSAKVGRRRKGAKGLRSSADAANSEEIIVAGRYHDFSVTEGRRLAWKIPAGGTLEEEVELQPDTLPMSGYFGLDAPEVRFRMEGLDNFSLCTQYIDLHFDHYVAEFHDHLSIEKQYMQLEQEGKEGLMETLCNERWSWRKVFMTPECPPFPQDAMDVDEEREGRPASIPPGFKPFLLGNLQHSILESVFSLWDFLEAAQGAIGSPYFSLLDLVKSVNPPGSLLTTCSQMVFDEVNCMLTEFLFEDIRHSVQLDSDKEWQNLLAISPINVITWPAIVERVILVKSLPLGVGEMRRLVFSPPVGEASMMLKVLCLLFNHPHFDVLCPDDSSTVSIRDGYAKLRSILGALLDEQEAATISVEKFVAAVWDVIQAVLQDNATQPFWPGVVALAAWFVRCIAKLEMCVVPPTLNANVVPAELTGKERSWGGFTLRHNDISTTFALKPYDFDCSLSKLDIKSKLFKNLERCVLQLTNSDSESWSATDRIAVYSTLVDYGMSCQSFEEALLSAKRHDQKALKSLPKAEVKFIVSMPDFPFTVVEHLPKSARCHFTGVSAAVVVDPSLWTVVPLEYAQQPGTQRVDFGVDGTLFALKDALARVVQCRTIAINEQSVFEASMSSLLQSFQQGAVRDVYSDAVQQSSLRSLPIGYDRYGNSFWLFAAQECMTVFPFDSFGRALDPADPHSVEPCILLRDPKGMWSYHCSRNIDAIVRAFSDELPCEHVLRVRLIERYHIVRSRLKLNVQLIKPLQQVWLEKKMSLDRWIAESNLYTGANDAHRCRQLEVIWARCAESRMNMHYAALFRNEEEIERVSNRAMREALLRRQRRMKELMAEDCFDHHCTKGWSRIDAFTRIRQLAASTTASRILGDSQICAAIQSGLSKSLFLEIPPQSPTADDDGVAEDNPSGSACTALAEQNSCRSAEIDVARRASPVPEPSSTSASMPSSRTKAIEQLHLVTGEVLRVYHSGRDAATFMNVSQSGISQCLNGIKTDCYGFRWRVYEGPVFDFESIKDRQMPLAELKALQLMRGRPVEYRPDENHLTRRSVNSEGAVNQQASVATQPVASAVVQPPTNESQRFSYQTGGVHRAQSQIVTSNVTAPAKLVKLKAELLNLLFIFPEKALRWSDQDPATEGAVQAAGENAAAQVHASAAKYSLAGQAPPASIDLSPENVERLADRASRKAKRRLRRKLAVDNFLLSVQKAANPQQLLAQVLLLESVIPDQFLFNIPRQTISMRSTACSVVGAHLYALDRRVAYCELHGVENAGLASPYKLRFQFAPRCHANSSCVRFMGHVGKCSQSPPAFSRLPDHFLLAPPQDSFSHHSTAPSTSHMGNNGGQDLNRRPLPTQASFQGRAAVREGGFLVSLSTLMDKPNADIEMATPYLPSAQDVSLTEWV